MGRRNIQEEPRARILYRVNEAAAALGISRAKMYDLLGRGEIGYVRVGSDRRVPLSEIEAWIKKRLVNASV